MDIFRKSSICNSIIYRFGLKREIQRKANRSGNVPCEICGTKTILEQHHIRGRKIANANKDFNLANICPNCHTKIHNGIVIVEDRVLTTDGYQLVWHHYKEASFTGRDAIPWQISNRTVAIHL